MPTAGAESRSESYCKNGPTVSCRNKKQMNNACHMHYSPAQYSAMRLFYTKQLRLSYTLFVNFSTVVPNPAKLAVTEVAADSIVVVGLAVRAETAMAAEVAAATAVARVADSNSASVETGMIAAEAVAGPTAVARVAAPNPAASGRVATAAAGPIVALAGPTVVAVEQPAEH
jgi:hypothetical protein